MLVIAFYDGDFVISLI